MKLLFPILLGAFTTATLSAQTKQISQAETDSILHAQRKELKEHPFLVVTQRSLETKKENNTQEWLDKAILLESVPRWGVSFYLAPTLTFPQITKSYTTSGYSSNPPTYSSKFGFAAGAQAEYFLVPKSRFYNPFLLKNDPTALKKALKPRPIWSIQAGAEYRTLEYQYNSINKTTAANTIVESCHSVGLPVAIALTLPLSQRNKSYVADKNGRFIATKHAKTTLLSENELKDMNIYEPAISKWSFYMSLGMAVQYNYGVDLSLGQESVSLEERARYSFSAEARATIGFRWRYSAEHPQYLRFGLAGSWMLSPFVDADNRYFILGNSYLRAGYIDSDFLLRAVSLQVAFEIHDHQIRNKKIN